MILLIGGTADTAPLATMLAEAGYEVLVSTATGIPLAAGKHPRISRRAGILDRDEFLGLLSTAGIQAVIDAAHPYAEVAHRNARAAAAGAGIPYLAYVRPAVILPGSDVIPACSHAAAAEVAFSFGKPVLLTTGSRNLSPYLAAARRAGVELVARVLDSAESLKACGEAGIAPGKIVTGRGPFSVDQNVELIRKFGIGVIVTKDSGVAGGVSAKREAARREGCFLVVVSRPEPPDQDAFADMAHLLMALRAKISPGG